MSTARDWHRVARVRVGSAPALEGQGDWFERALVPAVEHPLARPHAAQLLRHAALRALHSTVVLEVEIVNPVALAIAQGRSAFLPSVASRRTAMQLYCDEAYHAVLAQELCLRLGDAPRRPPAFQTRLEAMEQTRLLRFLFTVVTETCLTDTLKALSRSTSVHPAMREFAADHFKDEARHCALFSGYLAECWPQLTSSERAWARGLLPSLIDAFLRPDVDALRDDLRSVGLSEGEASTVLAESYPSSVVTAAITRASRSTLSCLQRVDSKGT